MALLKELYKKVIVRRFISVLILFLILYSMRSVMDLLLLTFLLTYFIYTFEEYLLKSIRKFMRFNEIVLILLLYTIIFIALVYFVYKYLPIIVRESLAIINQISNIDTKSNFYNIEQYITPVIGQIDLNAYIKNQFNSLFQMVASIGKWGINVFVALMLSLFFLLGKEKIKKFLNEFNNSRISDFYKNIVYFAKSFLNSFGKVIQAQVLIAMTNSILSIIALSVLGFPQLIALGFMIFILSLVPIAGTIISFLPLAIIAFNIGGLIKVIYVIVLILVLHAFESYILNPQFMSSKTEIPVFFVFIILIVSQHFLGLWGLLMGIPIFMFLLDLAGVNFRTKRKKG